MDKQHGKKELQGMEEGSKAKLHLHLHKKKYKIGKLQAMISYMDSGLKTSPPVV